MMLLLLAVQAMAGPAASEPPPKKLVARIERAVRMPAGAAGLRAYDRYYAYGRDDGSPATTDVVTGVYLRAKDGRGVVRPVAPRGLPLVTDGGCDVVTVVWDAQAGAVASMRCNGES